jgi:FixJ family two-component response regulator
MTHERAGQTRGAGNRMSPPNHRTTATDGAAVGARNSEFRILIVDDDPEMCRLLEEALRGAGHAVSCFQDPRAALAHLDGEAVDLLITDLRMPFVDGLTLMCEARRRHPDLLSIVVTGYATLETAIEALRAGAYDLLMKPLNLEEVRTAVRNAAERVHLARENRRLVGQLAASLSELEALQAFRGMIGGRGGRPARGGKAAEAPDAAELALLPSLPGAASPPEVRRRERGEIFDQLERLGGLRRAGVITEDEFQRKKQKLLERI